MKWFNLVCKFLKEVHKMKKHGLCLIILVTFCYELNAQLNAHQVTNWQIMRSTDKLSNQPFIRKYLPKQLDGRWTQVKNSNLLSNFADWIQLEYRKPGEDPYYNPWSIPWSTWFLKAPLFDSVKISNGFYQHYKLRLNRLECAEVEVYINEHKLNIVNPTYGQTFIDQTVDITPFLRGDGLDTIFLGFVSQMTNGLTMQRLDLERFTADNEEPSDSIQKLFYGGIEGQLKYDGLVKISPYFRRPMMDFGWDIARPNIHFGLGNGIECIGWSNLYPLNSNVKTDSIVYDQKGSPTSAYVTFKAEFDADFTGCKSPNQFYWAPNFDFVIDRNYTQKIVPQKTKTLKNKVPNFQVIQLPEDWVQLNDTSFELLERAVDGLNFDSACKLKMEYKFLIHNPKLWYPNGYFEQVYPKDKLPTRYRFGIVYNQQTNSGQYGHGYLQQSSLFVNAPFYTYTGLRTLDLDTTGVKFSFKVNGKKIMALGTNVIWGRESISNWVEGDSPYFHWMYHGATPYHLSSERPFEMKMNMNSSNFYVSPDHRPEPKYKQFRSMFKLGMNMVRFWGGGNYPPEEVYAECDKLGILIWQDLMFSGTTYPKREDWKLEVGNELDANISWMKTHPSLALICGNNEIEVALKNWGWFQKYHLHGADSLKTWTNYRQLFDTFIPRKLQNIAPNIFYLPSSPIGNWGNLKQMKVGDNHDWGIWHGERNFNHVDSVIAPFVSEFGFPSLPNGYKESTDSLSYQYLQFRSYKGLSLLNRYSKNEPKNTLNYLVAPQLKSSVLNATKLSPSGRAQAMFLDRAFRAYRTSSKDFGGCLFWQWNDADRVVSWSVVDVDLNQKPAFEQLKYSLKPVTSFVRYKDSTLKVSIQSNAFKTQAMTIQLTVENNQKISVFKATKVIKVSGFSESIFLLNPALLKANSHVRLKITDANGLTLDEF